MKRMYLYIAINVFFLFERKPLYRLVVVNSIINVDKYNTTIVPTAFYNPYITYTIRLEVQGIGRMINSIMNQKMTTLLFTSK